MKSRFIILFLSAAFLSQTVSAQEKERSEIEDQFKWDLEILYNTLDDWQNHRTEVAEQIKEIPEYKGRLDESAETLYDALRLYFDTSKEYLQLLVYANRKADEDLRRSETQALREQVSALGTNLSESASFIDPELLMIDPQKIKSFYEAKPGLKEFQHYIEDVQRLKNHTLSSDEEQLLASAGMMFGTFSTTYNIFGNAEMPNPVVTLSDGKDVELSAAGYYVQRQSPNREDRKKVFEAFFENYGNFQNTIGTNLAGKVKGDYFYAKNRKYDSALQSALDNNNIPVSVYKNLIDQINANLPTLHRFLELKKRMLGVDTLHYYDLYTPIVKEVDMKFEVPEAQELLLEVFKPMGDEYLATVTKAFNDRWIDFYPSKGKRSGAYSSGAAYDFHPFILMNWTDDYESLSTLSHELGHTLHSYFTNTNQPFVNTDYATFVAEIASTMNENLLNNYMIKNVKSEDEKLYLLGSYLELLRTTIFRQTSFAEFEWEIHKVIENGEPLTGEKMSEIYYDIVKRYYGDEEGYCKVDPYIAYEWAYIPHFINYTYYVYQYSTSLIYSTALAEKIMNEGQPAVDKYYNILKGGGSDYPINLIKKAGLDPLTSEAFDLTMKKMNDVMDQIKEILDRKG